MLDLLRLGASLQDGSPWSIGFRPEFKQGRPRWFVGVIGALRSKPKFFRGGGGVDNDVRSFSCDGAGVAM
jgi:hypothetical protein